MEPWGSYTKAIRIILNYRKIKQNDHDSVARLASINGLSTYEVKWERLSGYLRACDDILKALNEALESEREDFEAYYEKESNDVENTTDKTPDKGSS